MSALILLLTVAGVLAFGIATAYGTIFTILSALAPRQIETVPARPMLAHGQSAGAD